MQSIINMNQNIWSIVATRTTFANIITTTLCLTFITAAFILYHPTMNSKNNTDEIVHEEDLNLNRKNQDHSIHFLSLVIPAYNEELRLPPTLVSIIESLHSRKEEIMTLCQDITVHLDGANENKFNRKTPFEIIIVNDGSNDNTTSAVKTILHNTESINLDGISIRLLTLPTNSGKGAAVKTGMLHTNGHLCLMLDADNATNFQPSILKLLQRMTQMQNEDRNNDSTKHTKRKEHNKELIVFGSRAHLQEDSKANRSFIRTCLMIAFHFFVKTLCSNLVHDTQCGFKLFTRDAAILLFDNLHLTRWAFDTEVVVMAEKFRIPITEVGVEWEEVDGSKLATSKLALLIASIEMLRDMLYVNVMYTLGLWKLHRME